MTDTTENPETATTPENPGVTTSTSAPAVGRRTRARTEAGDIPDSTDVIVVGGGPVGALTACLLARRGVRTVLVEKQVDLGRDFRGETVATPTVEALRRLGFGAAMREHGFLETTAVVSSFEGKPTLRIDYSKVGDGVLPIDIPQPGLIDIFNRGAEAAGPDVFAHAIGWQFQDLVRDENGAAVGAILKNGRETREVSSRMIVGADGRFSKVRRQAELEAEVKQMDRDFMSFVLPRPDWWGSEAELIVNGGRHLVVLPTFPDKIRVGHNLPKRGLGELRKAGFDAFKQSIRQMDPRLADLVDEHLTSWDDCGFLEIFTAELDEWSRDGLVLIGDASHTGTPILGQGVNLGIRDAVLVAPVIDRALRTLPTGPIPAETFAEFERGQRQIKKRVTGFQRMQEGQLAKSSPADRTLRRIRFAALNALPIKHWMLGKVINATFPVDPVDVSNGVRGAVDLARV